MKEKVAIIDFDGTLCKHEFPNVGPPELHVKEAITRMKEMGYTIKIHSCRTATYWGKSREDHIKLMREFLTQNEIPYDEIILDVNMDKPLAEVYIDDRAIGYKGNWFDVLKQLEKL